MIQKIQFNQVWQDANKASVPTAPNQILGIQPRTLLDLQKNSINSQRLSINKVVSGVQFPQASALDGFETLNISQLEAIGIIGIEGYIGNSIWFGGITGEMIEEALIELTAQENPVRSVILQINSGGGAVTEMQKIQKVIRSYKDQGLKFYSLVDSLAASAAYAIAAETEKIYSLNYEYVVIGSIGVLTSRWDYSEYLEDRKINARFFASGSKKLWGYEDTPLSKEEELDTQAKIDRMANSFFTLVSKARNIPFETVQSWQAGVFETNEEALNNKLIDQIVESRDDVIMEIYKSMIDTRNSDIVINDNLPNLSSDMSNNQPSNSVPNTELTALTDKIDSLQAELNSLKQAKSDLQAENKDLKTQLNQVVTEAKAEASAACVKYFSKPKEELGAILAPIENANSLAEVKMHKDKWSSALSSESSLKAFDGEYSHKKENDSKLDESNVAGFKANQASVLDKIAPKKNGGTK